MKVLRFVYFIYSCMKTREDLNKYYDLVNKYIDAYLEEWNIKPSKLKKYLSKSRVDSFLEKNGLSDINLIGRVIDDIINDRVSMEIDQVLTFESFVSESIENNEVDVYSNLPNAGLQHEKILADAFDTSLSRINVTNPAKHMFNVDGILSDSDCVVFTKDDITAITENMKGMVEESVKTSKVKVKGFSVELEIGKFLDENKLAKYCEEFLTHEKVTEVLKEILGCEEVKKTELGFIGMNPSQKHVTS